MPAMSRLQEFCSARHLLARRFPVPKLQRNFVWDVGRAAKLLDRIYRETPIYGYSDCHMSSNYG